MLLGEHKDQAWGEPEGPGKRNALEPTPVQMKPLKLVSACTLHSKATHTYTTRLYTLQSTKQC